MKKLSVFILATVPFLLLFSCQQIFTYSVLEWGQRDAADLSLAQQIAYAEAALASGDEDAIIAAYNALADSDDPEINLLASDLALAGSGINEVMDEGFSIFLGDQDGDPVTIMDDLIDSLDVELLEGAVDEFESALSVNAEPTDAQYLNAAVALILVSAQTTNSDFQTALNNLSDVSDGVSVTPLVDDPFDPTWTDEQKSYYYILQAGLTDISDLQDMFEPDNPA